ncbi:MAG: Choline-sulfatase [Lentisphaerae bacterium ADurb.BinA184]|nr:MAG: Choline-sulfatase [Lentisphaerae bacterium ADurb.BinA184]
MPTRPNVLFIISDQHHAKCLGHAGHPQVRTPHLDRLAREGVRFANAVANNPICTPSRMCYLSGQYVHNHGYYGLSGQNPGGLPTLFGQFRRAGYRTAAIGKLHGPAGWIEADTDVCLEAYAQLSVSGHSAYDDYLRGLGLDGDRDDGFLQEQGPDAPHQTVEARPSRLPYVHSVEGWCVQEARRFIAGAGDRPWMMQVSLPRPHEIYAPAQEFWDLYDDDSLWLPPNTDADLTGKAPHLRRTRAGYNDPRGMLFAPKTYEALRRRKQHGYLGCVSHVDHAVGELLEALDAARLAPNTIVIYTADHGDYASEFGILEKAPGICGDAICRIPSLWRWPGRFAAGHAPASIVETVDLAPTLCALCGLDPMPTADGVALTPLLEGGERAAHTIGVTENPWSKAVLKGDWRLVHYPRGFFASDPAAPEDFGELYNLADDPWERWNLYFDPACRDRRAELERDLLDWLITTTRIRTMLPPVLARDGDNNPVWGGEVFNHHWDADGKLSWRAVAANAGGNYI